MSWSVLQEQVYRTKISDVGELKRRIKNEWADLNHAITERVVGEWRLSACVHAGCEHLEHDVKMMWLKLLHVWWFLRDNNCQSCLSLFNDSLKFTCNYCVDGSIWHFEFPKVVLARISGEVGTLCTVLLSVYSGTRLPIFIEIGSYLTDTEQKISLHSFFETRCSVTINYCYYDRSVSCIWPVAQ